MNSLILSVIQFKYPLLIPLAVVEGSGIMTVSGFLIKLGYLKPVPTFICLMIGDMIGDFLWYHVGYFWGHPFIRRFGKYVSVTEESVALITRIFHRYKDPILFVSKITAGFGFSIATLITAGLVHIPRKRFLLITFFGELVWTSICLSVGYFLGHLYTQVTNVGEKIFLGVLALIILGALYGFTKYMRERIKKSVAL